MSELRKDPVVERWVIISDDPLRSPSIAGKAPDSSTGIICPFCPGNEHLCPPEILSYRPHNSGTDENGWTLRVIPNRSPLLMVEENHQRMGEGLYDKITGVGANEVIIETPVHDIRQARMSTSQIENLFWTYRDRILDLKKDVRLRLVLIYKNCGGSAGATLDHGYSLLLALPIVPKVIAEEIAGAKKHFHYKERCIFCDVIRQEILADTRIVLETDFFAAIEPFAPRVPFETWILPKRHSPRFEHVEPGEIHDLAVAFKEVLSRLDEALSSPDYNYFIHTAPFGNECDAYFHWHMEILPRLMPMTGLEWGSELYYNSTPPEDAANFLRSITPAS